MRSVALDANLLVLLVVGLVDRKLVSKHKRTRSFDPEDFDLLREILGRYEEIVITPNVMTEACNLISFATEPTLTNTRRQFALLADALREVYYKSAAVVRHPKFLRLGLSDSALLGLVEERVPLLTCDLGLYLAAAESNRDVVNFNHLRQARLLKE